MLLYLNMLDTPIQVVDSVDALSELLPVLGNASVLYVDVEGVRLSRNGSISIITIYEEASETVFLIDICTIKEPAFTTTDSQGNSLKSVLESPKVAKVFFDVRNDSDALYANHGISLRAIWDVQLMELAVRRGSGGVVNSLAKCIENDAPLSIESREQWKQRKQTMVAMFNTPQDDGYKIFTERPILRDTMKYCAGDVIYLSTLFKLYGGKLTEEWRVKAQDATAADRVKLSQSTDYDPHSSKKVFGPWPEFDQVLSSVEINELYEQAEEDFFLNPDHDWYDDLDDHWDDSWDDSWDNDTARDCIGWEEDMIQRGSPF